MEDEPTEMEPNEETKGRLEAKVAANRLAKLEKLTGRKTSVRDIGPFLTPETPEEAREMGEQIERSDKIKKVFGERPAPQQIQ